MVRAVLNGPPPGTADRLPSGWTSRSMSASPATTIMGGMVRGRRTLHRMDRRTDAVELLDGPLDDLSVLVGQPARPAADQPLPGRGGPERDGDRRARGACRRADAARRRDGRRRHPAGAPRARAGTRPAASRSSGSTAGPRSSKPPCWRRPPWRRPTGSSSTSATAPRSRIPTGRSMSPTARWCCTICRPTRRSTLLGEMARVARLGVVVNDLDRSPLGLVGAWLIGHLLTGNRFTRRRCAAVGAAVVSGLRGGPASAGGRPDAGADGARRLRPALGDRGRADADNGRPANDSRRARRRPRRCGGGDRRRRAGRSGPRRPARGGRDRGARPRAGAGLALARRRGLHLARGRCRAPARRSSTRPRSRPGRAADPRDARRDRVGDLVPADVRGRGRRRAGGRVRPVAARSDCCSSGPWRPAPTSAAAGT